MKHHYRPYGSFLFLLIFKIETVESSDQMFMDSDISGLDCTNGTKLTGYICLPSDYHKEISPKREKAKFAHIDSSMGLRNIRFIDAIEKTMTVDISLTLYWVDNRIQKKFTKYNIDTPFGYGALVFPANKMDNIWRPDLYIFDMKYFESYKVNTPVDSISILYNYYWNMSDYNRDYTLNNTVLQYYLDARAKLYCFKFSFEDYPMEENTCTFVLGTSMSRTHFVWKVDNDYWRYDSINRDEIVNGYRIKNISWINEWPQQVNQDYGGMGRAIGFKVLVKRQLMPFLVQYYIPCVAIVLLTHISFIIPLSAIPGRVALLVTEFLTLVNIFIHEQVLAIIVYL